jgi:hypothetical protein
MKTLDELTNKELQELANANCITANSADLGNSGITVYILRAIMYQNQLLINLQSGKK